jgi:hypothetical protein
VACLSLLGRVNFPSFAAYFDLRLENGRLGREIDVD